MSNLILNFEIPAQFKGLWSASVNYNTGEVAVFGDTAYVSLVGNNQGQQSKF
jgi:hypothetical protein